MNYDFFADKDDKIAVLDFIFSETDLHVYDLGSPYGEPICKYNSVEDIASKFDLENGSQFFQLWSPRHEGKVIFRRVILDPKHCDGYDFRFSTEGCGLIQLYFHGLK